MKYPKIAESIIELKKADLALRDDLIRQGLLGRSYHPKMQQLHNQNANMLNGIIDHIGYPTIEKVGQEASEAAWLVIQHAIGQPDFMKRCATLLNEAVQKEAANPVQLAYLSDRISVLEGNIQLYGTQFDWDDNNQLSPQPYDDLKKVNDRRKALGLNTLEEQTKLIRWQAKQENQSPPTDAKQRKEAYEAWRKSVGWTTEKPMSQEIERKFILDEFPERENLKPIKIRQGYLAISTTEKTEVRLRQADERYTLTVKKGDGMVRQELETTLTKEQFESLWPGTAGRRIVKQRYVLTGNYQMEIDVYETPLKGLLIAEIEFETEADANAFIPPSWMKHEVTHLNFMKNKNLFQFRDVNELLEKVRGLL